MIYKEEKPAILMLQDGTYFEGIGFGATQKKSGEVVFCSVPGAGYLESLTDPSYKEKLVAFTYPSIGNYGVPKKERDMFGILKQFESDSIKLNGLIVTEYCKEPSHYESVRTLEDWLIEENIPGIQWIDTRMLTQRLCEEGTKLGVLQVINPGEKLDIEELRKEAKVVKDPDYLNLAESVSIKDVKKFTPAIPKGKVVVLDLGAKNNILRTLLTKNLEVILVPYNYRYEKIMKLQPDGVLISNGPGNPIIYKETISIMKELIKTDVPIMGIELGNLLLGLAIGGKTYKLKSEHRGERTSVENSNNKCYITYHNHGYGVKDVNKQGFKEYFHDIDDNINEGIINESKPILSVQFNPEAAPGPLDSLFLFDKFVENMEL